MKITACIFKEVCCLDSRGTTYIVISTLTILYYIYQLWIICEIANYIDCENFWVVIFHCNEMTEKGQRFACLLQSVDIC